MDNKQVKEYLNTLYVDADAEELDFVTSEVNRALDIIHLLDGIDTTDEKMASWPYEVETEELRDDVVDHLISNEEVLQNAADTKDGYVKYVKVV